jgi:hypothetical protein
VVSRLALMAAAEQATPPATTLLLIKLLER